MCEFSFSNSHEAQFICYLNGKFEKSEGSTIAYVGGEVRTVHCDPQYLFLKLPDSLGISLYEQRTWYKLPFEELSELKLFYGGSESFGKMMNSAYWTGTIEIFFEKDDVEDDGNDDTNRGEEGNDREATNDDGDEQICDDGAEQICEEGDDMEATNDDDGDEQVCEEEARVEKFIANFSVEDESYDSEATPANSDDEEHNPTERYRRGSGELKLRQVFDSIISFKDAIVEYALKTGQNVRYSRWGSQKCEVICSIGRGCPFRVYCSFEEPIGNFMIKYCNDKHTCIKDGCSRIIKDGVIAKLFLNEIRKDPKFKPKSMQDQLQEYYDIVVSHDQCRKAKGKALKILADEYDEQFSRLHDYTLEISSSNPGSSVFLEILTGEDELEKFCQFYVCFKALKKIWQSSCRKIIGIDGCFLKNNVKGQLLAAVGRDANNQFFPIAWAIVQVEDTNSWLWFIRKLKDDLNLKDGDGLTLISDRQKGLLIAVDEELPKVEHRMCARHIYGNLKRVFPKMGNMKTLFWAVAKSYTAADYEKALEAVKNYDIRVYEAMMLKNPHNCSRAFFTNTACCEDVSNNFSESYNSAIDKAREMPLVEILETIRRQTMLRIDARKKKAHNHTGKYSLKVAETIADEERYRKHCTPIPGPNGWFEVVENGCSFKLHLARKTCTCRKFVMTGIPCRHALRVILLKKLVAEDYVSDWYLTSKWKEQYDDSISPMVGMHFWKKSGEGRLKAPPRPITLGPNKTQKRMKGKNESPTKKKKSKGTNESLTEQLKVTKVGRTSHCGRCSSTEHNIRRCPAIGVVYRRPKRKPKSQGDVEEVVVPDGEGPSQTQPSQS